MRHVMMLVMWVVLNGLGGPSWGVYAADAPAATEATASSPAVLLEKGIYTEETVGDLDAAIRIYERIVQDAKANRKHVAQAQYRLALVYLKKAENAQAIRSLKELIETFAEEKELVAKAREQLAKARAGMSGAEIAKIVAGVVTEISTMAEGDPRIPGLLHSLREAPETAVVKELTVHFEADKNTVRRAAIYVIWKGEFSDASAAVPGLIKLGSHEEDLTRGMAALALGALKAGAAFNRLAEMTVNDQSPFTRRCAAYALGLLGDPKGQPVLEKALKDADNFVRNNAEAALTMLAQSGAASPRVLKTTPAAFATDVAPTLEKISVTFDRPMMDKSWSFTGGGETFPKTSGSISYDAARTTCTLPVKLQPGMVYWVGVNSPSFQNFKAASGTPAKRYVILFGTRSADGKATPLPEDLLKQARAINEADKKAAEKP